MSGGFYGFICMRIILPATIAIGIIAALLYIMRSFYVLVYTRYIDKTCTKLFLHCVLLLDNNNSYNTVRTQRSTTIIEYAGKPHLAFKICAYLNYYVLKITIFERPSSPLN